MFIPVFPDVYFVSPPSAVSSELHSLRDMELHKKISLVEIRNAISTFKIVRFDGKYQLLLLGSCVIL